MRRISIAIVCGVAVAGGLLLRKAGRTRDMEATVTARPRELGGESAPLPRPDRQTVPRIARGEPRASASAPSWRAEAGDDDRAEAAQLSPNERLWRDEPEDASWTEGVEAYVLDALGTLKIPLESLGEVSCKQTLCKLTFAFDDTLEAVKLQELRHPDFALSYSSNQDEYEVFIQREAPALEQPTGPSASK